ncbi:MAG TPA: transglycosylase SLT domain-containing protein [Candidatus Sulfotelmatobacter sp.]|nr:transglycosylase SLT domain-containing protein [Candidatus Sulfotelmatobacter sp.]
MVQLGLKWRWVLALAGVCAFASSAQPFASIHPQQSTNPAAADSPDKESPKASKKPPPKTEPDQSGAKKPVHKPATTHKKSAASHAVTAKKKRKKRPISPRVRRIRQAFVASTTLRPMAQQLLQDRTPAAYAGVEAYARAHNKEDAGALAWLVLGYAHFVDHDYAKAIEPLNRAKPMAGDLGDYISYYLGTCYLQTGREAEGLAALANFEQNYPDSLLIRDAHLSYANALISEGRAAEAADLLVKDRAPVRSDIELALGKAYATLHDEAKASEAFNNIYYKMPTSPDADAAYTELKKLSIAFQPNAGLLKVRADLLMKAHRYADAADTYREYAMRCSAAERPSAELNLADALHHSNRNREVKSELAALSGLTPDQNAQRLYIMGEVAWAMDDNNEFYRTVDELRSSAPTSSWLESALLSAGNLHLVHHEYDQALDSYRELQQRFPKGVRASYAHWKTAWLTLRQGRNEDAKKLFEEQIAAYPNGNETSAALYWRARLAEEDNQPAMAQAFYQKLSDRYRNYYYAELGRQRMKKLPATADPPDHYPLLDHIPPLEHGDKITLIEPPDDDLHLQKGRLLGNGGLVDLAVREFDKAASDDEDKSWEPAEVAQLYTDTGHYDRAIEVMKHSVPSYFAVDIPTLPREYWEALFPRPYWSDLKKFSIANGLDPYLVASLIRQESEFNPIAVSRANAVGLMQLLPRTGKLVSHQVALKHYNPSQLYTPTVNLQLGTKYFRGMVDQFGGSFEQALAAYNAGTDRVEEWMGQGKYRDTAEFVESIPFTETREYVQAIMRNASVYRQLYGNP